MRAYLDQVVPGVRGPAANKQTLYRMPDGCMVATYDNGKINFQGTADSPWVNKVTAVHDALNA
ncbi:hypothetical protein [Luteibacter sp.]|jgi:hypothetical protein|uniref:hypothetical protein n=1 Tax=Luteibacter sp. TaxID=1886636 RepID=UPI002F412964